MSQEVKFDTETRERAEKLGIDLDLLAENLRRTTQERLIQHQDLLVLMQELSKNAPIHKTRLG